MSTILDKITAENEKAEAPQFDGHQQQADGPRHYHECLREKTRERRAGLMKWLSADTPAKDD